MSGIKTDQQDKWTIDARETTHVKKWVCLVRFTGIVIRFEISCAACMVFAA
jgi:hypothetical protein